MMYRDGEGLSEEPRAGPVNLNPNGERKAQSTGPGLGTSLRAEACLETRKASLLTVLLGPGRLRSS